MSELKGCSSNSCAVTPPKGVGTNGPCRCRVSDYRGQSLIRSLQAEIERYRKAMKDSADGIDQIALSIPPPNVYTPRLKMWAIQMRNEAIRIAALKPATEIPVIKIIDPDMDYDPATGEDK